MEKAKVDFNLDSEGGKYFFGEHYDLETAKRLYREEEYDDEEVAHVIHCYVHFGIVWIDDERRSGWTVHNKKPKSMRGYKKASELIFKKDIQLLRSINPNYCKKCVSLPADCICNISMVKDDKS